MQLSSSAKILTFTWFTSTPMCGVVRSWLILCMGSELSSGSEIMKTLSDAERSDSSGRSEKFYNLMKMRRKQRREEKSEKF